MSYKITNAMKTGTYSTQYGEMVKYTVQFEGSDEAVELSRKPSSPAPRPGDILEGTIEATQYGKRFKAAQTASGGFAGKNSDPATRASIEAQTSLNAAVTAVFNFNSLKETDLSSVQVAAYATQITQVAKLFAKHLQGEEITVAKVQEVMPGAEEVKPETLPESDTLDLSTIPF